VWWRCVLVASVLAAVASCNSQSSTTGKRRIAVIPKGTTHDFWKSVHYGALKAGEELGVEIIWKGPHDEKDKEAQIKLVESLTIEGVDGIVLAPIDRTALIRPVHQAKQRNIPTVIFDSGLDDTKLIVSYVATDNYKGGCMAAERLAEVLGGRGNVIMLRYAAGSESTEQREQGFLETLKKYPDITVISDNQRVGSNAEEALQKSASLFQSFRDQQVPVNGVFTVCEPNNKGMLLALENANLAGQVMFVGFDSDPLFVKALREKKMHGIVLQDPVTMGYRAVQTMVEHLDGKQVERVINTGEYLATPENMDEPRMQELLAPQQAK
jgi:ribose transport system substrate-binding protein